MRPDKWIFAMKYQQNADRTLQWLDSRKHPQREVSVIPTTSQSINLDSKLIWMFVTAFFLRENSRVWPFYFCRKWFSLFLDRSWANSIQKHRNLSVQDYSCSFECLCNFAISSWRARNMRLRTVPGGMSMIRAISS